MAKGNAQRWRQTTVWVHVLASVGWMSQAFALAALGVVAASTEDAATRLAAVSMAHTLDGYLLAPMANAAAFTGFVLSAATAWGYVRHWWVLTKFALTLVQLYAGIFILSKALNEALAAAQAGRELPSPMLQVVGAGLMGCGLAFQAWLSVAKPGGKTRWARAGKPATAPTWVFVGGALVPLTDLGIAIALGDPMPMLSLLFLAAVLVNRGHRRVRGVAAETRVSLSGLRTK
ncbi:hypothetical protein GCM10023148_33450 [Actinokineospora soli]